MSQTCTPLTAEELAELDSLASKGTPRPWYVEGVFETDGREIDTLIVHCGPGDRPDDEWWTAPIADACNPHDNPLIVAAVNALPSLLADIAELRAIRPAAVKAADTLDALLLRLGVGEGGCYLCSYEPPHANNHEPHCEIDAATWAVRQLRAALAAGEKATVAG